MARSIADLVRAHLTELPQGTWISASDFPSRIRRNTMEVTLSRMCKAGQLRRVGRGKYVSLPPEGVSARG